MSSVTRFLRQVPTGLNFAATQASITSSALDFIPTSGNYVGNYPPGFVVQGSATGLQTALSDAGASGSDFLVRDMGKTIFAPYGGTSTSPSQTFNTYGYFRQYQAIIPSPISATQGFIGGNGGNTFGVAGPSAATTPGTSTYLTFYLPVSIGGVGAAGGSLPSAYPVNGGQM